jgi:hypothetical protein
MAVVLLHFPSRFKDVEFGLEVVDFGLRVIEIVFRIA